MNTYLEPYPTYKETPLPWLPEVPEHWTLLRVKYLFKERTEKGYPNEPLLAATQTKGVVPKSLYENRTVTAQKDLHLLKLVCPGDFVISLRSFEGGIELAHYRGIISPAYTVLEPGKHVCIPYFALLLKSQVFIDNLTLFVTGIREGQNIEFEKFSRSLLPVPPLPEQEAIAKYLNFKLHELDQLIALYRRLVGFSRSATERKGSLLFEYRTRLISDVITGALDVRQVSIPEINLPLEPEQLDASELLDELAEEGQPEVAR